MTTMFTLLRMQQLAAEHGAECWPTDGGLVVQDTVVDADGYMYVEMATVTDIPSLRRWLGY